MRPGWASTAPGKANLHRISPDEPERRIGAAQAALVSTIEPAWTIALAAILFGQTLAPVQLAGGALIIIGVIVAQAPPEAFSSIRPGVRLADE